MDARGKDTERRGKESEERKGKEIRECRDRETAGGKETGWW